MSSSSPSKPAELPGHTSPLEDVLPFGRIKLIVFDLDGTMLRDSSSLPGPRLSSLQRSALHYSVRITLATGRTLWGAKDIITALGGLKNMPVILYNGSIVTQGSNRLLQRKIISSTVSSTVVRIGGQFGATTFIYEFRDPVITPDSGSAWPETVYVVAAERGPVKEFNGMSPVHISAQEAEEAGIEPCAMLLLPSDRDTGARLASALADLEGISVTSSGGRYIEIRPAGVSKAEGIRLLSRTQKIVSDQVLAVGDNDNDVELMRWAGTSVAVKGASDAARNAATHVSRHGAEDAAIEVLDLVRLAHRLEKGRRTKNVQRGNP